MLQPSVRTRARAIPYLDPLLEGRGEVLGSGHRHFPSVVVSHDGGNYLSETVAHQFC